MVVRGPFLAAGTGQTQRVGDEAGAAEMMGTGEHVVAHGHGAEQGDVLERPADASIDDPVLAHPAQGLAGQAYLTVLRAVDAADAVEQRGLAGAVRADQAADLAEVDRERHTLQRADHAKAHRDIGDL